MPSRWRRREHNAPRARWYAALPTLATWVDGIFLSQGRNLPAWSAVGFGIGDGLYFSLRHEPILGVPILLATVALIFLCVTPHHLCSRVAALMAILPVIGFCDAYWATHRMPPMPALPHYGARINATICAMFTRPARLPHTERLRFVRLCHATFETPLDLGMAPMRRDLVVRLRVDDPTPLSPGANIAVKALLYAPQWPAAPFGRDPQRDAWFSNRAGYGRALTAVTMLRATPNAKLARVRQRIAGRIAHVLSDPQVAAIAQTLLVGESSGVSCTTREAFSAAGLAHLLAVAGLHLGIVMTFVALITRQTLALWPYLALRLPCREISALVSLCFGAGYTVITGAHLPAIRSLGMAALLVLALVNGRRVFSMRSLAIVALVILLPAPQLILDASFQMSFSAVMALIAGYRALGRRFEHFSIGKGRKAWLLRHGFLLTATSLLAGSATLPIVATYFGVVQPFFVFANLIAVPLTALWVLPSGIVAMGAMIFHMDGFALKVMGLGIEVIRGIAQTIAGLPGAQLRVPMAPTWGLTLYLLSLAWLCLWCGRARLLAFIPMAVALASPWLVARPIMLISSDASIIAVKHASDYRYTLSSGRFQNVVTEWRKMMARPFVEQAEREEGTQAAFIVKSSGRSILFLRAKTSALRQRVDEVLCPHVGAIVSRVPLEGTCRDVPCVDRFSVWRNGAYAIYANRNGVRLVSDRSWRGQRPWVPRIAHPGFPNLPLARRE